MKETEIVFQKKLRLQQSVVSNQREVADLRQRLNNCQDIIKLRFCRKKLADRVSATNRCADWGASLCSVKAEGDGTR